MQFFPFPMALHNFCWGIGVGTKTKTNVDDDESRTNLSFFHSVEKAIFLIHWQSAAATHGAVGWITQTKRSLKNNYMDTSGMTPEKFWHQKFFPPVGLPLNKILKNCWRAPWPARRPEILHAGHWPQYATFIFYTNFCAMKFLLIRFLKNALRWVYGSDTMVGEGVQKEITLLGPN